VGKIIVAISENQLEARSITPSFGRLAFSSRFAPVGPLTMRTYVPFKFAV
jgi:hypothetical protein